MNTMTLDIRESRVVGPGAMKEIVRGEEKAFLESLEPVVRKENVWLDLSSVERIDAAGVAALIQLYCDACAAGHEFRVLRPRPHVREVLGVVGLDRLLYPKLRDEDGRAQAQIEKSAA